MSEEPSVVESAAKPRWGLRIALGCGVLLFLLLLAFLQRPVFLELVGHFLLGWVAYAYSLDPPQFPALGTVLLPALCSILVLIIAHHLARTWSGLASRWRFAHTLVLASLLFLAAVAMPAVRGMARSAADLVQYPLMHNAGRSMAMSAALDSSSRLLVEIEAFEQEKGRFPESLEELEEQRPRSKQWTWMSLRHASPKERFQYIKPMAGQGSSGDYPPPMLISPQMWGNRVVVGFPDGYRRMFFETELEEMLEAARTHEPGASRP